MEAEGGVKAPVTRSRRRVPVEKTDENKSPALNTPTKKRGGRLAAKPELELIDENTLENSTARNTKKLATKDVAESEEKTTPSRRSTRIKSNTSVVSESSLAVNSPRAKRATRRASLAGSDSEATVTPVRQTRKTRKDSASSIEKELQLPSKPAVKQITEPIVEETETIPIKSTLHSDNSNDAGESLSNVRKSPRLLEKVKKDSSTKSEESNTEVNTIDHATKTTKHNGKEETSKESITLTSPTSQHTSPVPEKIEQKLQKGKLSICSVNLIDVMVTETKTSIDNISKNNSMSAVQNISEKPKRKRTSSWTTMSTSNSCNLYSDNEITKSKSKDYVKSPEKYINKSGSGDNLLNNSIINNIKFNESITNSKKVDCDNFVGENIKDSFNKDEESLKKDNHNKDIEKDKKLEEHLITTELLGKEPIGNIKTTVFMDDSDSNTGKTNTHSKHENEDQCVPVVEHPVEYIQDEKLFKMTPGKNDSKNVKDKTLIDNSCEPMDVDETIPENMILTEITNNEPDLSVRKSTSIEIHGDNNLPNNEIVNKSRKKSSITPNLDKSASESKSTLILSLLKDVSIEYVNDVPKLSHVTKNTSLSKSVDDLNISKGNDKKTLSLQYSTSTPLQDKNLKKLKEIYVNTSIIKTNDANINTNKSDNLESSDEDIDSNEITQNRSNSKKQRKNNVEEIIINKTSLLEESKNIIEKSKKPKENFNNMSEEESNIETKNTFEELADKVKISEDSINKSNEQAKNIDLLKEENSFTSKLKTINNSSNNNNLKRKSNKSSRKSVSSTSSKEESEEEMESEGSIKETNYFISDEAEDAGIDYESGDSQEESERQYLKENEILDKGETLSTEDEFSNDSDYENDSFVVSSNEEDDELLEGTDDDLSMSSNELKMTAKSKKKFDERKSKEQKKASREMYQARHKINTCNESSNSKINRPKKRRQLSSSESEEEISIKPNKNKRMRIDSTKESSQLESEGKETIIKENDISIESENEAAVYDESIKENDSLISNLKEQQNTHHRRTNSTVSEEGSQSNDFTETQTEIDPLQATMASDDDDDSLNSVDESIMQNYDSVLKDLNNEVKMKRNKSSDISLNLDKKIKKKKIPPVVDELNLTQVKYVNKSKNKTASHGGTVINSEVQENKQDDGASSDSIDLHLLFSEESNNSDDVQNKNENDNSNVDRFIPLKRKEGQTDILENIDKNSSMNVQSNQITNKKDKKRKSHYEDNISKCEVENINFFIDTVGTYGDQMSESHNISSINTADSSDSDSSVGLLQIDENLTNEDDTPNGKTNKEDKKGKGENSDNDAPLEISYKKDKDYVKRKSKEQEVIDIENDEELDIDEPANISKIKTPGSQKKQKQLESEQDEESVMITENPGNESVSKTPASEKKRKRQSLSYLDDQNVITEPTMNDSISKTPASQKKKKRQSALQSEDKIGISIDEQLNDSVSKTSASQKRTESQSEELNDITTEQLVNDSLSKTSAKKKKKTPQTVMHSNAENGINELTVNESITKTPTSQKKKKRQSDLQSEIQIIITEPSVNASMSKTPASQKKKNRLSALQSEDQIDLTNEEPHEISLPKTPSSLKKNQKSEPFDEKIVEYTDEGSKKRKRKASLNVTDEQILPEDIDKKTSTNEDFLVVSNEKKKRKISPQDETEPDAELQIVEKSPKLLSRADNKNNKKTENKINIQPSKNDGNNKNRNNKRKERDDDNNESQHSKILKENSFKKVPRLPPSLLMKLNDRPPKVAPIKKDKVISTTQFLVEQTKIKRNKPSKYLEESVYLNDEESDEDKTQKKRINKPKVLPFVPTASTSNSGYTSNFKVNVIPSETILFAAQPNTSNFRDNYLYSNKIKRLGTYNLYKKQRTAKMSKF